MKTMRGCVIVVIGLLLLAAPTALRAAPHTMVFDPDASRLTFVLDATLHNVEGKLFLSSGEVRFDGDSGEISGELVVDATRTDTDNKKRDKKMHGRVLESESYPQIVFRPSHIDGQLKSTGHSEIAIDGTMSIHGDDHPMKIPVSVDIEGDHVSATASFSIPYVEWGMKDPSVFVLRVAKEVDVTVDAVGRLTAASGS